MRECIPVVKQLKEGNTGSVLKVATFFSFSDTIIYIVTKDSVLETSTNFFFSPLPAIFVFPNDNPEILYKIKISASGKKVV